MISIFWTSTMQLREYPIAKFQKAYWASGQKDIMALHNVEVNMFLYMRVLPIAVRKFMIVNQKNAGKNRARAVPAPKNGAEFPGLDRLIFFFWKFLSCWKINIQFQKKNFVLKRFTIAKYFKKLSFVWNIFTRSRGKFLKFRSCSSPANLAPLFFRSVVAVVKLL